MKVSVDSLKLLDDRIGLRGRCGADVALGSGADELQRLLKSL
jgi:hypothetical protein